MPKLLKTKGIRISDGEKGQYRLISVLSSWLSLSINDALGSGTGNEVLKPLYGIVGDLDSEQMEPTVESTDDTSTDKTVYIEKVVAQPIRQSNFRRSRFLGIQKKSKDESGSAWLMNASRAEDDKSIGTKSNRPSKPIKNAVLKKFSISCKKKRFQTCHGEQVSPILRLPFFYPCPCVKINDSDTFSEIAQHHGNSTLEMEGDDHDSSSAVLLGVAFAHPVYTGKRNLLVDEIIPDTSNYMSTKIITDYSLEADDTTLSPMETIVQAATVESWGSLNSSSPYPTGDIGTQRFDSAKQSIRCF